MSKQKIAIAHPQMVIGGGSEACAAWILETLKTDYDVSLICLGSVDFAKVNECYGTHIKEGEIKVVSLPLPWFLKNKFDALRGYRLARYCKKAAPQFDLMISTYNVMDFGRPGMQLIADFSFDDALRRQYDPEPKKTKKYFYQDSLMRRFYLAFAEYLSGESKGGWKKNVTIANSHWTADIMKRTFGLESKVVYPPVVDIASNMPFENRQARFLFLGRVSPEKQVEKIIGIIKKVRDLGIDVGLDIVGKADDMQYANTIKDLCRQNNSWCQFLGPLYGQEKLNCLADHKFGISGRTNEPFGIGVAEMTKAGCLVFVPSGGGQTEIVKEPELIYDNEDDAVKKITKVLNDASLQSKMLADLQVQSQEFSVQHFTGAIKHIIKEALTS